MIQEFWRYATTHLPAWAVFIVIIFLSGALMLRTLMSRAEFREPISFWLKKRIYNVDISDLKSHRIFRDAPVLKHKVESVDFEDKHKENVLKIFYNVKIDTDIKVVNDFILQEQFKNRDWSIINMNFRMLTEMSMTAETEVMKQLVSYLQRETNKDELHAKKYAKKIFDYVMDTKNGFREHRSQRFDGMYEAVELIHNSPLFDNNFEKMYQLIDFVHITLATSVMRMYSTFKNFNGKFNDLLIECKQ